MNGHIGLSDQDIQALMKNPTEDLRASIAQKVAHHVAADQLSDKEIEIAHNILSIMTNDVAERVRRSLSESLKHCSSVPHDVAMTLAQDIDSVALPMLEFSPVFTDADLIEIVQSGAVQKQIAIAGRETVSDSVAGALVDTTNSAAIVVLAGNKGADMSEGTVSTMLDRHGDVEAVGEHLAQRNDLTLTIAERLTAHVSQELHGFLREKYNLTEHQALGLSENTRERATVDLVEMAASAKDVAALAAQLHHNGRLTASLMLRCLCTGDIRFFEACMAELAGVTQGKAAIMIHDPGELGLKAIFKRCRLPVAYFPAFRIGIDVYKTNDYTGDPNDRERFKQRMIERILTQYDNIDGDDIDYLINNLGQASQSKAA